MGRVEGRRATLFIGNARAVLSYRAPRDLLIGVFVVLLALVAAVPGGLGLDESVGQVGWVVSFGGCSVQIGHA